MLVHYELHNGFLLFLTAFNVKTGVFFSLWDVFCAVKFGCLFLD